MFCFSKQLHNWHVKMHELSPWSSLDRFIVSEFISDPSITKILKYICYLYSKRCCCCPERSDAFFLAGDEIISAFYHQIGLFVITGTPLMPVFMAVVCGRNSISITQMGQNYHLSRPSEILNLRGISKKSFFFGFLFRFFCNW